MQLQWIDAHCHLSDLNISHKLDGFLKQACAMGVNAWLQGGIEPAEWERQIELSRKYPGILPVFGLHPWWVSGKSSRELAQGLELVEKMVPQAFALGETGLDFSPKHNKSQKNQILAFESQLRLAKHLNKPVVLHLVRSHHLALPILRKIGPFPAGAIVHGFSSSAEIAHDYWEMGFLISVGAQLLRPTGASLKRAVLHIPPQNLVIETDAPDGLAEPSGLVSIAQALGALLGKEPGEVLEQSSRNLKTLLKVE